MELLRELALSFVPIFFAMDAIGNLPIFIALTEGISLKQKRRTIDLATFTALVVGLGFVAVGKGIFLLLGIQVSDFLIAGGTILLVLSVKYLITGRVVELGEGSASEMVGVVPLGTPLIVGPAVLTTLLLLIDQYFIGAVLFSFLLNLAVQWVLLKEANRVLGFLGHTGVNAASKIIMLLLAAIAIKMIRQGAVTFLG